MNAKDKQILILRRERAPKKIVVLRVKMNQEPYRELS